MPSTTHKVRINVDLSESDYQAFLRESRRRGVTVEALIEQTVHGLLVELEQDEEGGTDHPIIAS